MKEFRNDTNLKFTDISSEEWREYVYNNDTSIKIDEPLYLNVSKSGGHRVFAKDGVSRYIAPGWKMIKWKAKEGEPHFVK